MAYGIGAKKLINGYTHGKNKSLVTMFFSLQPLFQMVLGQFCK
jgi:hypothetical protein